VRIASAIGISSRARASAGGGGVKDVDGSGWVLTVLMVDPWVYPAAYAGFRTRYTLADRHEMWIVSLV
jgi:hypothetical protein